MQNFKKLIYKSAILLIAAFLIIGNLILPKLVMAEESWVPTFGSIKINPYPAYGYTATWTGSKIVVLGGYDQGGGMLGENAAEYDQSTNIWTTLGSVNSRGSHTAVWTGSKVIIFGGFSDCESCSLIEDYADYYEPSTQNFGAISMDGAPNGRSGHTAIWTGPGSETWHNKMIIWGGDSYGTYHNDGGIYDPEVDSWSEISTDGVSTERRDHTAVWTGSKMIVWGGNDNSGLTNTGGIYDPSTDTWSEISTTDAPSARSSHTAVWTGSKMVVFGGYDNNNYLNDGGIYDLDEDSWTPISTINVPSERQGHTAIWTGTKMVIWGGVGNDDLTDTGGIWRPNGVGGCVDTDGCWVSTPTINNPGARAYHFVIWTGTEMIVWGGTDTNGYYFNSGGKFNPSTNSWTPYFSTANGGAQRDSHTAIWTGSKMIIFGGNAADSPYCGGGVCSEPTYHGRIYDPVNNTWTLITDSPRERSWHSAVWTGSKMLVWAGNREGSYSDNTLDIYDPSTDEWAEGSNTDAPEARYQHSAIWTGTEMIVWGGGLYNTGGKYNPSTDTWEATDTSDPDTPSARYINTLIWTGSGSEPWRNKMIVWGGSDGSGNYSNDGGIYDPSADSWAPISITDAPDGRWNHTAVWTGSKMIVWGGATSGGLTDTGGIYDPATDTWSEISTIDAPSARQYYEQPNNTSVWTGSKMIVWGGEEDGGYTNTGGIYDPATNTWTPTTTINAPGGTIGHTVIWTGSKMIVWGGYESGGGGGIYTPSAGAPPSVSLTHQTSPTPQGLLSTFFVNSSVGYAVGTKGTIVKTDNGGSTWDLQTSGTSYHLFKIYCLGETVCATVGGRGTVLGTSNGTDWIARTSNTERNLHGVYFADADNGWAVGSGGTIINTTDGGLNWSPQVSGTTKLLYDVYFSDVNTGYAVGEKGIILKTTDGTAWDTQNSGTANHLFSISFAPSSTTGLISGSKGTILKTTTGSDWNTLISGTKQNLYGVSVVDADNICVVGSRGTLLRTADGSTFSSQNTGITKKLFSAKFIDSSTGWLMGTGTILKVQ